MLLDSRAMTLGNANCRKQPANVDDPYKYNPVKHFK
jgi:hypothetical protein